MYAHFSKEQRVELAALRRAGFSLRQIARLLGMHNSSLSRELRRNQSQRPGVISSYHAAGAQRTAQK